MKISEVIQSADWKSEKHAPVIEAPEKVKVGEGFAVKLSVGKEIAHPNTTEHHIRWIRLYFKPDNSKFVFDVAAFEFNVHGESVDGANKGPVYTEPAGTAVIKLNGSGTLIATSYCNIHGLWERSQPIVVEG
jgi:superoxide reductase